MKIKVKRYREIEQIALAEALGKIILEEEVSDVKLATLENALRTLGLQPSQYSGILGYIKGLLDKKGVIR